MPKQKFTKNKIKLLFAGIVATAVGLLMPTSVSAWGPERTIYDIDADPYNLPDHATFNSITSNSGIGDEVEFVRIRDVSTGELFTSASGGSYEIKPGGEYEVVLYYHNDASSTYNTDEIEDHARTGIAYEARMKAGVPSVVSVSNSGDIAAWLSYKYRTETGGELQDGEVYDTLKLTTSSERDITLRYVAGSAYIYNDYDLGDGAGLQEGYGITGEALFGDGVLLGYSQSYGLDGLLPGCNEYAGRIVFTIYAEQPNVSLSKTASLDGENFYENVKAKPGDVITYKIEFTNTGSTLLEDVTFRDYLPDGVTLVPGTTKLYNSNFPEGTLMKDVVGENGFITGSYEPTTNFILYYQVRVNTIDESKVACGTFTYVNTATVVYKDASEETTDVSTIEVEIDDSKCTPTELPHTGPAEIALALIAIVCIAVGGTYWIKSQKDLEIAKSAQMTSLNDGEDKNHKA